MSDYPPGLPSSTPTPVVGHQPHNPEVPAFTGADMWVLFVVAFVLLGMGIGMLAGRRG